MNFILAMGQPMCGTPGSQGQGNPIMAFMPLIILFGIFYFLLIRPQQTKQKEFQKMLSALEKGDKVITSGGIHGIVAGIKDDVVSVKVADNVKLDISKNCIASVKKNSGAAEEAK